MPSLWHTRRSYPFQRDRNQHPPRDRGGRLPFCYFTSRNGVQRAPSGSGPLVANGDLLLGLMFVVISLPGDHRRFVEVMGWRRRRRHPLQPHGVPGIGTSRLSVTQRPDEIDHGYDVAHRQDGGACRREHVQHLEFRRISMVAARQPHVAGNEQREKRGVEPTKTSSADNFAQASGYILPVILGHQKCSPAM